MLFIMFLAGCFTMFLLAACDLALLLVIRLAACDAAFFGNYL
jgi:hypothetical protein